ncbi:hypothetical protein L6452_31066 [Arctium lappa]|uniref:Uncharacterized protein n=1 Tax=Arctium lappa TaxID=4217 RepID=A0ACB8ZPA0_ARCLA|nr:hypothetical protein L6452_31066 [Arctium lappa]
MMIEEFEKAKNNPPSADSVESTEQSSGKKKTKATDDVAFAETRKNARSEVTTSTKPSSSMHAQNPSTILKRINTNLLAGKE